MALVYEDIDGQNPPLPWRRHDLDRVVAALGTLYAELTPSPVPLSLAHTATSWFEAHGCGWQRLLDERPAGLDAWSARHLPALAELDAAALTAVAGETLLHFDVRADDLLLTPSRVLVVDWPHARVGAGWLDLVWFAPSVGLQGGPSPEELLARHPASGSADPSAVTAGIAAAAGYSTWAGLQPPPPGLPTVRACQAAQGAVARRWLAERTGWE
jgi:hypothetical protein